MPNFWGHPVNSLLPSSAQLSRTKTWTRSSPLNDSCFKLNKSIRNCLAAYMKRSLVVYHHFCQLRFYAEDWSGCCRAGHAVLTTTSRALEPNSETGRSRSLVRKRGTTYHNQSALLTVLTVSSENLNFIFLTHVLMFELFMYVYSYCHALSARFFAVDRALNSYFMIMIMILLLYDHCKSYCSLLLHWAN